MPNSIKVSDIYNQSRGLLNDTNAQIFTDAVLLTYAQVALNELAEIYEDNGLPLTDKLSSILTITTVMFDIGGPSGPSLPVDLVEVESIYERTAGTVSDFQEMQKRYFLPETTTLTSYLMYWVWQGQIIKFLGATNNIEVRLEYVANIFPKIIDGNTVINVINCLNALAFRTAALAAEFVGENPDRALSLNNQGSAAVDRLVNLSIRSEQGITTRKRPFRANYKMRSQGW